MNARRNAGFTFVLAVVAVCVSTPVVEGVTFTKIISVGDPLPDTAGNVASITQPVYDEGAAGKTAVIRLNTGIDPGSFQGIYLVDANNKFLRMVSTESPKPGGGTFSTFINHACYNGVLYFTADPFTPVICKVDQPGGPVTLIAAKGDFNQGTNQFQSFAGLSAYSGGAVFEAYIRQDQFISYVDIFHYNGGAPVSLIGYGKTAVPGPQGYLFYMANVTGLTARDGEVFFHGFGYPSIEGMYAMPVPGSASLPRMIVDTKTKAPGSTQTFTFPGSPLLGGGIALDLSAGEAAFFASSYGNTNRGIYRNTPANGTVVVANRNTPVPGGSGNFAPSTLAGTPICLSAGQLVFKASDAAFTTGVYVHDGTAIQKVIVAGEELAGAPVYSFDFSRGGLLENQLLLMADLTLYRVALGGPALPDISLHVALNGDVVEISWDGTAAGPGAILQVTESLSGPNWQPVVNQSNPFHIQPQSRTGRFFRLKL